MTGTALHTHLETRTSDSAAPRSATDDTPMLQTRIDQVAAKGGGEVRVSPGHYTVAGLQLYSGVTLFLEKGVILQGGTDPEAYGSKGWHAAMIVTENMKDVAILGEGIIDGQNICRPGGEEGFRGFHALAFYDSVGVRVEGVTIQNAGNYAVLCQNSSKLSFHGLCILGGHDGIHIQKCREVSVADIDFRTGDDCLAGTDNQDVCVEDCYFNTACNAFRLGVLRLTVRRCVFQGPGEHPHQVSVIKQTPRFSMGAAFVHFSPTDRNPELPSDDWLIEDCTVDQCEALYLYNHKDGVWQTGQPARNIRFRNIRATRLDKGIQILGDIQRSLHLDLSHMTLDLAEAHSDQPVMEIDQFGSLHMDHVTFSNNGKSPVLVARRGERATLLKGKGADSEQDFSAVLEEIQDITGDF